jgi:uncharacterized membrane protein
MQKLRILLGIILILSACSNGNVHQMASSDGQKVMIDTDLLREGIPVFYTFEGINFFVIKTDNAVHAYLDACEECYIHGKGFRYEDGRLICNYCNVRYPMDNLEYGQGRCHPIKLKGVFRGHIYEIDADTLLENSRYFR